MTLFTWRFGSYEILCVIMVCHVSLSGEYGAEQYGGSAGGAALRAAPKAHCSLLPSIVGQYEVRDFKVYLNYHIPGLSRH